ncbi:ABC transporter ATP-binding protein [Hypericibacter adhaerens]|uniref:ABC transporter ATP-binding protein n=1 Tax=Hypericibacter adhaerens TaxID=2602016 RepID=A0A5J6N0E7_9PROT|nr:sugar ABC transporter ATP-binding protein [Hypericibacter adhaerens]QEX20356.1 ABC transporter ATP-binding protein [Hypericibacter adhaerens]
MDKLIELIGITKEYRGALAVNKVDFDIRKGEVHALIGENGAGKSTLTKIIAGAVQRSAGRMLVDGRETVFATPREALQGGVAMVFQETSLVPSLTVAQNLYLGDEPFFNRLRGIYISAQQFLQSLNFSVDPARLVSTLGAAQRMMVETARAVHHKARLIIFDEPTATLTPEEKHHFFALVGRLKAAGVSVIFISHALEEALAISDRITVLRDGECVLTASTAELDRDKLVRAMVGRALSDELYGGAQAVRKGRLRGEKVLSVQNLSYAGVVKNNTFSVYAGQVTGMFGLIGSGRTETAKVIAGVVKRDLIHGGEIYLMGRPIRYRTPRPAVLDRIVYVTEDRKVEGFFETMSIAENVYVGKMASAEPTSMILSYRQMMAMSEQWRTTLNVKAISSDARVIELSGGNQQKVVIAKSLAQKPKLIIFDEPTRGVDVGAIAEIHQLINRLADEGIAIIMISSYLPEILRLSDRILVTRQGRVVEEFNPENAGEEKIMYAAVH